MSTISGKSGKVLSGDSPIANIIAWQLRTRSGGVAYASSETGGYRRKLPGAKQAIGSLRFLFAADAPQTEFHEGDSVSLLLHLDSTRHFDLPANIDSLHLHVDIDSGQLIGGQIDFTSDGAWSLIGMSG